MYDCTVVVHWATSGKDQQLTDATPTLSFLLERHRALFRPDYTLAIRRTPKLRLPSKLGMLGFGRRVVETSAKSQKPKNHGTVPRYVSSSTPGQASISQNYAN